MRTCTFLQTEFKAFAPFVIVVLCGFAKEKLLFIEQCQCVLLITDTTNYIYIYIY